MPRDALPCFADIRSKYSIVESLRAIPALPAQALIAALDDVAANLVRVSSL